MFRSAPLCALASLLLLGGACDRSGEVARSGEEDPAEVRRRPAPDFAVETLDGGDSLHLADLDGFEVVLMNFWASWCAPCKAEIPDLMTLHEDYSDQGFTVLGVTVNDLPRDSREFAEMIGMTYPSVIGTPQMLEAYGLSPWLPTSLLVVDGEIVREWVGPRTREEFEYAVRVGLGQAPPLEDILQDPPGAEGGRGR